MNVDLNPFDVMFVCPRFSLLMLGFGMTYVRSLDVPVSQIHKKIQAFRKGYVPDLIYAIRIV